MVRQKFQMGLLPDARKIRQAVFVEEQGFKEEFDAKEDKCWNLVLYLDKQAISTGRLEEIDPETYQLERIAVIKELRHQKIGSYTVKFMITHARNLGARKVILASQLDKMKFYSQLGFKPYGDGEVFYEENYPHIMMYKVIVKSQKPFKIDY